MIKRTDCAGGAVRYSNATASVYLQSTRNGVFDAKYVGIFDVDILSPVIAETERRAIGLPELGMFLDLSELKDYPPEFRNQAVEWFRKNQNRIARASFLQKSALVRIGLSIVGVALKGKLEAFTDPEAYARARSPYGFPPIPWPARSQLGCQPAASGDLSPTRQTGKHAPPVEVRWVFAVGD